jgi:hypothetical protein
MREIAGAMFRDEEIGTGYGFGGSKGTVWLIILGA